MALNISFSDFFVRVVSFVVKNGSSPQGRA